MLRIENLSVHYGAAQALDNVSLKVGRGETVALVGANGAGKSTLLKTVMGILRPTAGRILIEGRDISGMKPTRIVRQGVALSPEGRELFGDLSVRENLCLGVASQRLDKTEVEKRIATMLDYFPPPAEPPGTTLWHPVRRRAADGSHGPRSHVPTPTAPAG